MPPQDPVANAALYAGLVPMVAAAIVYLVFTFIPRGAYFGAVLAVVVGFAAANLVRDYPNHVVELRVLPTPADANDPDPNFDPRQVAWGAATALGGPSIGEPTVKPSRLWLPWCVVLAGLAGAIGRLPWMPTSVLRVAAALAVAILLSSPVIRTEASWLAPVLVLVIVAEWELLETVGKGQPGAALPLAAAIVFAMTMVFVLLAHTARYAEGAGYVAACCLGVAISAWARRGDASGLAPILSVGLPGLMVVVRWSTDNEIPIAGYVAIALAPLGLIPAAMMVKCERVPKWAKTLAIILGPVLIAAIGVVLARMYEELPTLE
jgi:hypothetical protein